jgi:putative membrane-bound dehydrogenase-like protein
VLYRSFALLLALPFLLAGRADLAGQAAQPRIDRQYRLEATMLGYRGVGGTIAGIRNPTLWARTGETVRIVLVNGEVMVHDIALDKLGVKSQQILAKGEATSIVFKAERSDTYYCSLPGHRQSGMEGKLDVSDEPRTTSDEGTAPRTDQRTLNLDFESGALSDWTATGDAFSVVKAAGRSPELRDAPDDRAGEYWVSSRPGGNANRGVLTSAPFPVTHPYASFLVSGGAFRTTRVEIVRVEDGQPILTVSGADAASLRPVVVDLRAQASKLIMVRLVDDETGAPTASYLEASPWAHIAFDRFRFHSERPFFPDEMAPAETSLLPPLETATHAGLSGVEAARAMTVPDGFTVTLAAAEPDVVRPIAFAIDDRGRLWVAEAHSYPLRAPEGQGRDRILIFEDTDGDGRLDRRKVFIEKLNLVSGLEVGFGGVWVGAAPHLLFIPMKPGTDRPSGPPQVLLDGWGYHDTHETLNTFRWGPDGWLYGTHGVFTHSKVGKPGTPDAERTPLNAGIWRYHPTRHVFERFAEGTSNPWGLDFNDYGHAFTTACVIEHLYHVVQGGRYVRQDGRHFNRHTYDDIETIADHKHWVGNKGPHAANGRSGAAGGGHAHAGAMIYLGGDGWPAEYRNAILMHNIHGFRANMDRLARSGSGYAASHGPDFLLANDAWSQMLNFQYGPDGSVHVIDWYDKNQCHSTNPDLHQKTMGRIFKISHKSDRPVRVDLARLPSSELVAMQLHRNDWYVQHARRLLQERGPDAAVHAGLKRQLADQADDTRRLRALWALHVTDGLAEADLVALLADASEYVRGWAIALLVEARPPSEAVLRRFAALAREDASALVRLHLASALQRVPVEQRWDVVEALAGRAADAADANQPLMLWYAAEPLVAQDMPRALALAADGALPRLFGFTVQRIADVGTPPALVVLADRLSETKDAEQQRALLSGITQIVNRPVVSKPASAAPAR